MTRYDLKAKADDLKYVTLTQPVFYFILSIAAILLFWSPYLILGENASLLIHDNLDSNFVWLKVILDSHLAFAPNLSPVEPFMNGIFRSSFPSELNLTYLWYYLFGSFGGYVAGLPLISWSFLNLRRNEGRLIDWLIIIIYPFYASLVMTGLFFIAVLLGAGLHDLLYKKIKSIFSSVYAYFARPSSLLIIDYSFRSFLNRTFPPGRNTLLAKTPSRSR